MKRVIAIHGSTGSGKSTLTRLMGEYLGTDCLVIQENLDELLKTSSAENDKLSWYHRTTAISASDNVTHFFMDYISPLSVLLFTLAVYFIIHTVWPVIILFIIFLSISRLCRWLNSHILSKIWLCNVFLFLHREQKSNCPWIWRDRTLVDTYAYCLLNKAISVPLNMGSLLLEQTHTTSVAIIMDVPQHIIEKHLKTRMNAATTSPSFAFVTRLILLTRLPIQASIDTLALVERWYQKMNVPVIKISQLRDKLDNDTTTGEIQWSKHSLKVLIETIEQAIEQRKPPSVTIDESLMPWQTIQSSRLLHI